MILAHKIALDLNNTEASYLIKACGVARFAYNWGLAEWQKQYEERKEDPTKPHPSEAALRRLLNSIKREQFPWMLEVTKNAPQMAIMQLGGAFKNFFAGKNKYPRFRVKGRDDRFTLTNDQFTIKGLRIRIPNLGWLRMREELRFRGKVISATISCKAGKWFVSIAVEIQDCPPKKQKENSVGVDLGISALATLSTGEKIKGPKPLKTLLARLKRYSKSLSRKTKGSKNRAKAKTKLARLHAKISHIRLDSLHKLTTKLANNFGVICIEDLKIKEMLQNQRLSRSIADMGFHELRRQLEYKTTLGQSKLIIANRYFPSTKMCSKCKAIKEDLGLSSREWKCGNCGCLHDRDLNAAINLENYAVSSTVKACGGVSSGYMSDLYNATVPVKQEVNTNSYL